MTGRVGGLVEVYNTRTDIRLQIALERGTTIWNWSEMGGADKYCRVASVEFLQLETVCIQLL